MAELAEAGARHESLELLLAGKLQDRVGEVLVGAEAGEATTDEGENPPEVEVVEGLEEPGAGVGELQDDDPPPRLQYPGHLPQAVQPVDHVADAEGDGHRIEGPVRERDLLAGGNLQPDPVPVGG